MRSFIGAILLLFFYSNLCAQTISPAGPVSFCGSGVLTVSGITGNPPIQWQLNSGDITGATSTTLVVTTSGSYTVTAGGTSSPVIVTINPVPTASFTFTPPGQCGNTPVVFNNSSTGSGLTYSWNFGDPSSGSANNSTLQHPTHTFVGSRGNGNQNFTTTLTVTSAAGCTATYSATVTTKQLPSTALDGDGATVYNGINYFTSCNNVATNFTFVNNSNTSNSNYQIIWGDASPDFNASTFTTINHNYGLGNFPLLFIVTGSNGCKDTGYYRVFVGTNPAIGFANPGSSSICSGTSLTFPISNTTLNPPSTIYTVTFNDGTSPTVFSHPPPASITHIFNSSSCGVSSPSFPNSFNAAIEASNPCLRSVVTIVPIYVTTKPIANFTISPKDTVCVNSPVTVTNTSVSNTNNNNGTCTQGKQVWYIQPATGWTLTSGSLGTETSTNPALWISGSISLGLNFTTIGVYTIKLKIGNTNCGSDSIIKTICVNPLPAGSFTLSQTSGCAPFTVNTTSNTNSPFCGTNSFSWIVGYTSTTGCLPASSLFSYVGGTSSTSAQPSFQFNNPGIYSISAWIIGPAASCSTLVAAQTVTVKGKPVVTLGPPPASICENQSISPSASAACFINATTTYSWSFPGGTPATASGPSPGNIVYAAAGNYSYSLTVTNECGSTTVTQNITVKATPVLTLPGNLSACAGSLVGPLNFNSSLAGTSFTWTNSNTAIGLSASGTGTIIPVFTATNAGGSPISGNVSVSGILSGCTGNSSFTITVNPKPASPIVSSPVLYCQGATPTALTATANSGHTLLWYTTATGGTGSTTAPIPSTSTLGSTTYYVSQQSNAYNCEGPRAAIVVTVNGVPSFTATPTNPATCGGTNGSIQLTGLAANTTYTIQYNFNGSPRTTSLTSSASGSITLTGLSAGNYSNIVVVRNGCNSAEAGPFDLTDPTAPAMPTAGGSSPVCSGQTISLTSATSATGTISYHWSGPNSYQSTLQNPSILNASVSASGTYFVTITINGCTSPAASVNILVNPTPATPVVTNNGPVCSGTDLNLGTTATGAFTYSWTGPNGFTSNLQNPVIFAATTAASGLYNLVLTGNNGACNSTAVTTQVLVKPTPAISASVSQPLTCNSATGSIILSGLTPGAYQVHYEKNSAPVNLVLNANASGVLTISNLTAGSYSNIYVTLNGCNSNLAGPFVLTDPNPPLPPSASGNGPLCSGGTISLGATSSAAGTANWSWAGPGGYTSVQQNPVITGVTAANSGTYSVTVTVNGCASSATNVNVLVYPTPVIQSIGSNTPVCSGQDIQLNASSNFVGTVFYNWSGPNGFTSSLQNPVITSASTAASGNYDLTISSQLGSCVSAMASTTVLVKPTPAITATFNHPQSCNSSTGNIVISGLTAGTYQVHYNFNSAPVNTSLTASAPGVLTIPGLSAGTYTNIYVTLNGCTSNIVGPFTLSDPNPPLAPTAAGNSPICSGNNINLSALNNSAGNATWLWTGPSGYSSILQNPTIAGATLTNSGTYSVTASINGCTSLPATVDIIVNPSPAMPVVTSNSPVCSGQDLQLSANANFPGTVAYNWSGPAGFNSTVQNPLIVNSTVGNSGVYTLVVTAIQGSCPSSPASIAATVNPLPVIAGSVAVNPTICNATNGSIHLTGLLANTNYSVHYTLNSANATINIQSDASGMIIISNLGAGSYSNIFVTSLGCNSNAVAHVLSDPNPPAQPLVSSNGPVCVGQSLQLNASTPATGTATYNWTGPNGFNSVLPSPVINPVSAATAGLYQVTVTISGCISPAAQLPVQINPLPLKPTVISPVQYCIGTTASSLSAGTAVGNSLNWYNVPLGGSASAVPPVPSTATVGNSFYYVSQTNSYGCEGPRDTIKVEIHPDAIANFTPPDSIKCPPFQINTAAIGLQTYPANNSEYQWYANAAYLGSGINFPGYTIANENDSVVIKLKAISLFGCKADSVSHKFYTYKLPHPTFELIDTVGCGPLSVLVNNTTANMGLFTYYWNFGNGQTSTQAQPGAIIYQPNPTHNDTIYHVSLKIFSICDTITVTKDVRVKSKPKALFVPSRTTGCSPMSVSFANTSQGLNNSYSWDFGDGSTLQTNSPASQQHVYNTGVTDTFYVKLVASNECGSDSLQYALVVAPNNISLNVVVNGPEYFGCAPHNVAFYNSSAGANTFAWDFGDGNVLSTTSNIDTVYHSFLTPGTYDVKVTAANNCTDTFAIRRIVVFAKPVAAFVASQYTLCQGLAVSFTSQSTGGSSYLWEFGDGGTSTLFQPGHIYSLPGIYTVKLTVFSLNAPGTVCQDTLVRQVQVLSAMPGSFSVSGTSSSCAPFTVTFINLQRPSVSANWNFGDGGTAMGDSVVHTFTQPGVYNVALTALIPGGCRYNSTAVITINGPSGSLQYTGGYACYPQPVRLEVSATNYDQVHWDFGDGVVLNTTQLVQYHSYANPGIYIPSVQINNNAGCSFPIQGIDTIKVDKIEAGYTYTFVNNCGSTNISFTDTSHAFFGKAQVKWNFGDGNTGAGVNVTHSYSISGTYLVEMIIIGNSGCSDTIQKPIVIQVHGLPDVSINAPSSVCTGQDVIFSGLISSIDPMAVKSWRISNGATGTGNNFNYIFNVAGTYQVRFIGGTAFGCFDTAYATILVKPSPVVIASSGLNICRGNSVQLQASGATQYQWSPLQGLSCLTCPNPIASPLITTPYQVTGTNTVGCSDTAQVVITVIQPFDITVSSNDTICIGQSTNLTAGGATRFSWSPALGLSSTTISNPVANPTATTIYRVVGYDGFNCFTDTAFVVVAVGQYPTVNLGADQTLSAGTVFPLNSSILNGPIRLWSWTPTNDLTCNTCPRPFAMIKKDISYVVHVENIYGCPASDTIHIKVFCEESQAFIPNAFTPDGDGINDILMVRGKGIVMVKSFRIFNRWGEVVFEKSSFPPNNPSYGWNGKIKGVYGPSDVFVYTAEVICENGSSFTYKGNVSIIK